MVPAVSVQQDEKGTFEQISPSLLVVRALDRRWTGTLIFESAGGVRDIVEIQRGLICRALVPDEFARLGQLLVDAKVITTDELEAALELQGGTDGHTDDEAKLLGAALGELSLIDDQTLQRALVLQLLKRTSRLFGLGLATKWSFSPGLELFGGMPEGVRIDSLRVLWSGLSAHGEMGEWLDRTLNRIGQSPFQVRQDVNLRRYGFTGDARKVVRLVRDERLTLSQLVSKDVAPEEVVKQILYLLAITRYLDFAPIGGAETQPPISSNPGATVVTDEPSISDESSSDEASASDGPVSSDEQPAAKKPRRVARIKLRRMAVRPAAPDPPGSGEHRPRQPRSSGDAVPGPPSSERSAGVQDIRPQVERAPYEGSREQLATEIKSRLARISDETPFSLLGVQSHEVCGKTDEELMEVFWNAYETCSQKWHPDNCPSAMSDLRDGMAKIYEAMTEAYMSVTEAEDSDILIREFAAESSAREHPPTLRSETGPPTEEAPPASDAEPPSSGERPVEEPKFAPAELHTKALIALSEQRLEEADRLCAAACRADGGEPDYQASSAWIRASMEKPDTKVLLLDLDAVLRDHPDHVQARFYRGVLRRRLGSDHAAKRDFERVLELQEGHAGAKAQIGALSRKKKKAGR